MPKLYRIRSKAENKDNSRLYLLDRYKYIMENIKDILWAMNTDFVFTFVSPNAKKMTGYEPEELIGQKMFDFLVEDSRRYMHDVTVKSGRKRIDGYAEEIILLDVQFICKNGSIKWVEVSANPMFEAGRFIGYIGTTRDITEKKEYEGQLNQYVRDLRLVNARLEKMATVDAVTGAYNRRKFDDDLNLITKQEKHTIPLSLILFDIDNFKTINDCLGHKVGDRVLQSISSLVIENIRDTDGLFRWGGDEFIIILPATNLESAKSVAEKIRNIIQNYDFGIEKKVTISLGVGEYKSGENADQIIKRIDNALLTAKSKGKNNVMCC